jgi:methylated-DNA-[protein]-cysteine S-methyltransferase
MDPTMSYSYLDSPVGPLLVAGDGRSLHLIEFPANGVKRQPLADWSRNDALFDTAFHQLEAYFDGRLTRFDLDLHIGGTPFQNKVWNALCEIPFGETISYGELANRIGNPAASRAVGRANGANPLPIVIPCHRVIGSDRSLTGFGGGIEVKRLLLEHERNVSPTAGVQASFRF